MSKALKVLLLVLALCAVGVCQVPIVNNYGPTSATLVGDPVFTGAAYTNHTIACASTSTTAVTGVTVQVDSSPDKTTWSTGGVIAATACASTPVSVANVVANWTRVVITFSSGTGTVRASYAATVGGIASSAFKIWPLTNDPAACNSNMVWYNLTTGKYRYCPGGVASDWGAGAGGPPTGAAGGVLSGSYPNPGLVSPISTVALQDKGGAVYNVKAYGATGNGSTDDTASIQSAITAACAANASVYLPAGTFKIVPPAVTGVFTLTNGCNLTMKGAGMGASILQISATAGDYDTVIGTKYQVLGSLTFSDFTFDQNGANNAMTTTTNPRFFVGTGVSSTATMLVNRVRFTNVNGVNTIYSGAAYTSVTNCIFDHIGAGTFWHDASIIYASGNRAVISNNQFTASSIDAAGATTAIETHSSGVTVTGNTVDSMELGMNITGVQSIGDSVGNTVVGNVIKNGYYGIQLWSQTNGGHNSGYGLDSLTLSGNVIRLTQTAWTTVGGVTPLGNMYGIAINTGANLPLRNLIISGNAVECDLEGSSAPYNGTSGMGIGYWDAAGTNSIFSVSVTGNQIMNCPAEGVRFAPGAGDSLVIADNVIINPGSSLNVGLIGPYHTGIFFAPAAAMTNVRINNNKILDNLATSRMVYGMYITAANSDLTLERWTVSVADGTHASLLKIINVSAATSPAILMTGTVTAPAVTGLLPTAVSVAAVGSSINDITAGLVWTGSGTSWTSSTGYVPNSTTVNGHALSANVVVAPSDLASGALANGMTATTQSQADNSTKLATTAYVDGTTKAGVTYFWCLGVATSSVTIALWPGQGAATTCTSTSTNAIAMGAHTFKNLYCSSNAAGFSGSSGVVALYVAGTTASALTCTFGTGTACSDTSHTVTSSAGNAIAVRFTTQATETLSGVRCAMDVQ